MNASDTPLQFHPPLPPEDRARAGYYALLSRLFYAGPDAGLLQLIANAEGMVDGDAPSGLSEAWTRLALAARAMDAEAAQLEFDEVFVGVGKAPITPYVSFYLAETAREKILVRLKEELASVGLARAGNAAEPEDHIAAVFEVMRHLIELGSDDAALQQQKRFFSLYLASSYAEFCAAISRSAQTNFYKPVGEFARAFLHIESESVKVF